MALKNLPVGKVLGRNGFTLLHFKTFSQVLAPKFVSTFNSILQGNPIPKDTSHAHITVLLKPDKDHPVYDYHTGTKSRISIEHSIMTVPLKSLLWLSCIKCPNQVMENPIMETFYKVACLIRLIKRVMLTMTPTIGISDFVLGLFDPKFHQFKVMNKIRMQDFRDSGRWKSLADIQ